MVRKRIKRRISEEYNSEDSDYALNETVEEPVQKKYSLRQRKRQIITDDLSEESEEDVKNATSKANKGSDDDYETETEVEEPETEKVQDSVKRITDKTPEELETNSIVEENTSELIDFEDVIRADIVVNKHRVDYDVLIEKSEIKFQPDKNLDQYRIKEIDAKTKTNQRKDFHTNFLDFLDGNDKEKDVCGDIQPTDELLDCSQMLETQLTENVDEDSCGSDDLPLINSKNKLLENSSELKAGNIENIKLETNSDDGDVILVESPKEVIVLDDD